jgi:hypothetical protein
MRLYYYLIPILFIPFLFYSCSDESPVKPTQLDTTSFTYPFEIGNSWTYTLTISLSDFKPDTIIPYLTQYPITTTGTITILYDTVIYGVTARCFYDANQHDGPGDECRYYYINNDTGLILYAVRGGVSSYLPDNLHLLSFSSGSYSLDLEGNIHLISTPNDSLYITPNNIILKYPVWTGREWFVYGSNNTFTKRKYTRFEIVIVPAGTFSCMNVEKNNSAISFVSYHDYYSKYGIIKRTSFADDVLVTTPEYLEGIGTVDMSGNAVVTSYTIHQ